MKEIIVADDHPLFREALCHALEQALGPVRIIEAGSMAELQEASQDHPDADLVILDLHMPGVQGFSGLVFLRAHFPELPVCVISANSHPQVARRALDHGASAFIHKSSPITDIRNALRTVLAGDIWNGNTPREGNGAGVGEEELDVAERVSELTPQQFRVLMMLAEGLLNKQIAFELDISEATVKAHMTAIFRKLGVSNRTQAVLLANRLSVEPPREARQP